MPQSTTKRLLLATLIALLLGAATASAATLSICAAGCTYTNGTNGANLQTAIDAAAAGDTILLQEGFTYIGEFKLRQKSCPANDSTCYITIKTGVLSNGTLSTASNFPGTNIRTAPSYASHLAKIKVLNDNAAAIRTVEPAETGAGCAAAPCKANWWKLDQLEFQPNAVAGGELITLGNDDTAGNTVGSNAQDTRAEIPAHYILDHLYIHGDPIDGQKRAIGFYANDITLQNSYCSDIFSISQDSQCVGGNNSEGPYLITNNYLEAAGENSLFGGDTPRIAQTVTVSASPAPTTTVFTLSSVTDLQVGQGLSCLVNGGVTDNVATVTAISGNQVTVSPALIAAPDVPGSCNWGIVMKNLTFTKNFVTKPLSWRNPIVATPTNVSAAGFTTGGTLAAGTYFYRVVANNTIGAGGTARSTASAETSATVASGTTGSVTITWTAVPNAETYYVYGRSSGGENVRFTVTAPTVTFTDTGATGTTASVPTTAGTVMDVKNLFELKNMDTALIEGNVFEHSWLAGQAGYAVLFTVANSSDGNSSSIVKDITFRNNIVRSAAGFTQITGHDASTNTQTSQRGQGVTISNNLVYDIGSAYGSSSTYVILITSPGNSSTAPREGPKDVTIEHNTFLASGISAWLIMALGAGGVDYTVLNMTVRNNIARKLTYGMSYIKSPGGTQAQGTTSWNLGVTGTAVFTKNLIASATCSAYPDSANEYCPSEANLQAAFIDYANGNYNISPTSVYHNAATDGTDLGAIIPTITALTDIATSGNNAGGTPPPSPPDILTGSLQSGLVGQSYSTTLTASGGRPPYVWTVDSGTLPNGLTLSTGGVLSGTPTLASGSTFTVRVTDANTSTDTATYTLSITEPIIPEPRPDRVDWAEAAIFRRETAPDLVLDSVRVGDLWFDLSQNRLKMAVATSPALVWRVVVSGRALPFLPMDTIWTNMPAAETAFKDEAVLRRIRTDLTGVLEGRLTVNLGAAALATTELEVQYSTDQSVWTNSGIKVTIGSTANVMALGAFAPVPAAMATDVFLRLVGRNGDGIVDPDFYSITLEVR